MHQRDAHTRFSGRQLRTVSIDHVEKYATHIIQYGVLLDDCAAGYAEAKFALGGVVLDDRAAAFDT